MYQPNQDSYNTGYNVPPVRPQGHDPHYAYYQQQQYEQQQQVPPPQHMMSNGGGDYRLQQAMQQMHIRDNQMVPPPQQQQPMVNNNHMQQASRTQAAPTRAQWNTQLQWNPNAAEFVPRGMGQARQMAPQQPDYNNQYSNHIMYMTPGSSNQMGGGGGGSGAYGAQGQQSYNSRLAYDAYSDMQSMGGNKDTTYFRPQITLPQNLMLAFQGPNGSTLMEVQVAAEEIMLKPEQADTWTEAIVARITQPPCDDTLLSHAVNLIIEMALCAPSSSRHMAGVLVALCIKHNKVKNYSVLPQLHIEHDQRNEQRLTNPSRQRAFALLLAEIWMQMKSDTNDRIKILTTAVIEQIETLLTDEKDEQNIKWAATMLQVVEKPLAEDQSQKRRELAVLIAQAHENNLEKYTENGIVHLSNIIQQVTGKEPAQLLQAHPDVLASANSSRDLNELQNAARPAPVSSAGRGTSGGTAGGGTGSLESTDELTEEERRFIEENLVGGILHDDSASSPRVSSDDDEYNKDYEQFLANSKSNKSNGGQGKK